MLTTANMNPAVREELIKNKLERYNSQRIIIRIWLSGFNLHESGENVGHVSLETNGKYISLWPIQCNRYGQSAKETEGLGLFSPISHECLVSYENDLKYEGRPPEVTRCLYSLGADLITSTFGEIQKCLSGWSLLGLAKDSESCVSLAWRLLQVGGIEKLVSKTDEACIVSQGSGQGSIKSNQHSVEGSCYAIVSQEELSEKHFTQSKLASCYSIEMGMGLVVKSPDFLRELVLKAKQAELAKDPLTAKIHFEGETSNIEVVNDIREERKCFVM